jgi:hypothetical protein
LLFPELAKLPPETYPATAKKAEIVPRCQVRAIRFSVYRDPRLRFLSEPLW